MAGNYSFDRSPPVTKPCRLSSADRASNLNRTVELTAHPLMQTMPATLRGVETAAAALALGSWVPACMGFRVGFELGQ